MMLLLLMIMMIMMMIMMMLVAAAVVMIYNDIHIKPIHPHLPRGPGPALGRGTWVVLGPWSSCVSLLLCCWTFLLSFEEQYVLSHAHAASAASSFLSLDNMTNI
jgi:hypothetical protein